MSVLSVPRIFFKGQMAWNPATANNNDQWPTYDFVNARLDWDFLATQVPPITCANAEQDFPVWAQTLQYYPSDPQGWYQPPAEWNYYGGNGCSMHSPTGQTFVTGGQSDYGSTVSTDDSLVGALVDLSGDPFPETTFGTACRLVDTNPAAFWSTSFFLRTFLIGTQSGPGSFLHGQVQPGSLMSNRWMFLQRNLNLDGLLQIAGVAGGVLQACLPNDTLTIAPTGSRLLQQLDSARYLPGVKGVMVRLSMYMTQYFTLPAFAGCKSTTDQYTTLVNLWADDLASGRVPTENPAVSLVVGSVGLWMDHELVSAPGGRYLVPAASVVLSGTPSGEPLSTPFGPAVAEVNSSAGYVTLDLSNAIPELDSSGQKANFGSLRLELIDAHGDRTTLGTIEPSGYAQAAYEATAGIVDLPLPTGTTAEELGAGSLALVAASGSQVTTALAEVPLTVQTDDRAIWVDQDTPATFTIQVLEKGAPPRETVSVLLAQYLPSPPPPAANAGSWVRPAKNQPAVVRFDAPADTVVVPPGGYAQVRFSPIAPGFPAIVFFPFRQPLLPVLPPAIVPVFSPTPPSITTAFFSTARIMPFDNDLPNTFAALWASTHDPQQAWDFVYEHILALYSLLYPVMKFYGSFDLGDKVAVDQNISLLLHLTDSSMVGTTVYMPVTRDLSTGKRKVLQMYGWLVANEWPNEPIQGSVSRLGSEPGC